MIGKRTKLCMYHGTSSRSWRRKRRGCGSLYLTHTREEALKYADEQAANDGGRMLVMAIPLDLLQQTKLVFEPDDGWMESEGKTWKESLATVGSFRIDGDVEQVKPLFRIGSCRGRRRSRA